MALVSCPECGRQISDTAIACPQCGYVLEKKKEKRQIKWNAEKANKVFEKIGEVLLYIFTLQWADDIGDWMECIPVVGTVLGYITKGLLAIGALVGVVWGGGALIVYLFEEAPEVIAILGIVAANIFQFFVTTKRLQRNAWFFFVFLIISIPFIIAILAIGL